MPIRVLVVDDSLVMRSLLRMVLAAEPGIELAGMASDGVEALAAIARTPPDLVLLDIEMPRCNGLEVLARLREERRLQPGGLKVIMCSTLTRRGAAVTLEALAAGAADYVTKPGGQTGPADALRALSGQLLPKIRALCSRALQPGPRPPALENGAAGVTVQSADASRDPASVPAVAPSLVVIGVSTGGPAALEALLPALPMDFPLPLLIVQHMPQVFTRLLAERLDGLSALRVREAEPGEIPSPGTAYIARGDWHMELSRAAFGRGLSLRLTQSAPVDYCRPSVDLLFRSAAAVAGQGVLAAVLTGMGSDGLEGCRAVRAAGGTVLAQDRASSIVWGMPGVVAQAGLAHRVLPLASFAPELARMAGQLQPPRVPLNLRGATA